MERVGVCTSIIVMFADQFTLQLHRKHCYRDRICCSSSAIAGTSKEECDTQRAGLGDGQQLLFSTTSKPIQTHWLRFPQLLFGSYTDDFIPSDWLREKVYFDGIQRRDGYSVQRLGYKAPNIFTVHLLQ
jgi:hypothetical protein